MSLVQSRNLEYVVGRQQHVVIFHSKFGDKRQDAYILDIAQALRNGTFKVTILTSVCEDNISAEDVSLIKYSGWWIPRSIFNRFQGFMTKIKVSWMAWRLIMYPPQPKPSIVFVDSDPSALFILSKFSSYKLIYVVDFYRDLCMSTSIREFAETVVYAHEIIFQTDYIRTVTSRRLARGEINTCVLHPCINKRYWSQDIIDVKSFVPGLHDYEVMFVAFGDYSETFKFKIILEEFKHLLSWVQGSLKGRLHLVFAGIYDPYLAQDNDLYYRELVTEADTIYRQVTFIKHVSEAQKKTLIHKCFAILHLSSQRTPFEVILIAMSERRLIISVNDGYAGAILEDGVTAIFVNGENIATTMFWAAIYPVVISEITDRAQLMYCNFYSFERFSLTLHRLVRTLLPDN